jgi:ABC-type Zn uptake system ZnuABC Zn-binding protein ZnuA
VLREKVEAAGGLKVVTYHDAWRYFGDAFGIEIAGVIEPKPSITPSPSDLRRVIDKAKQAGVKVVVVETYNSYDQAKFVADAIGAKLVVLPDHVNGTPDVKSYQDLFRHNVETLLEAAK